MFATNYLHLPWPLHRQVMLAATSARGGGFTAHLPGEVERAPDGAHQPGEGGARAPGRRPPFVLTESSPASQRCISTKGSWCVDFHQQQVGARKLV